VLGFLSDYSLKHARINTVVPSQKEMDRVGVEPTTSTSFWAALYYLSKRVEMLKK